jgi:hypothetical protein
MATKSQTNGFEVSAVLDQAVSQFRGADWKNPGQLPWLPKAALWLLRPRRLLFSAGFCC